MKQIRFHFTYRWFAIDHEGRESDGGIGQYVYDHEGD